MPGPIDVKIIGNANIKQDPLMQSGQKMTQAVHDGFAIEHIRMALLGKNLVDGTLPPQLRAANNFDIWELAVFAGHTLIAAQKRGWAPNNIFYSPAYPDEEYLDMKGYNNLLDITHDSPHPKAPRGIITWKLSRRDHASIDTQPWSGRRPAKPFYTQYFNITNDIRQRLINGEEVSPQYFRESTRGKELQDILKVEMMMWDNNIRFDVFAKTGGEAEKYIIAWGKMLYANAALFKILGADKFLNWGRASDEEISNQPGSELRTFANRVGMQFRSVNFYVRTQEFILTSQKAINDIGLEWFAEEELSKLIRI